MLFVFKGRVRPVRFLFDLLPWMGVFSVSDGGKIEARFMKEKVFASSEPVGELHGNGTACKE